MHALERMPERGTTVAEVEDVLRTGEIDVARIGYFARSKVFPFARVWGHREYAEKKVRVVYAEEGDTTVVVTVYVYYGRWTQ